MNIEAEGMKMRDMETERVMAGLRLPEREGEICIWDLE